MNLQPQITRIWLSKSTYWIIIILTSDMKWVVGRIVSTLCVKLIQLLFSRHLTLLFAATCYIVRRSKLKLKQVTVHEWRHPPERGLQKWCNMFGVKWRHFYNIIWQGLRHGFLTERGAISDEILWQWDPPEPSEFFAVVGNFRILDSKIEKLPQIIKFYISFS